MDQEAWLARYAAAGLIVVGGLEWLFGRVISRFAAIPPLDGFARTLVEALGRTGIFVLSTAFILAITLYFITTLRLGERANRRGDAGRLALAVYLTLFGVFLATHAILTALGVFADEAWLNVTFNILSMIALWWLVLSFILNGSRPGRFSVSNSATSGWALVAFKAGLLLVALAYSAWYYSVLYSWAVGSGGAGEGGPVDVLRLGELAAVLAPMAFFIAMAVPGGEWRHTRRWIAPVVLLLIFAGGNIADIAANMGFTGVFAIWSVGFTLWLPWPLYGVSLALYLYTLLTCLRTSDNRTAGLANLNRGMGLLLLLFADYYLQLTYQHLLAILALLLLIGIARPLDQPARAPAPVTVEPATIQEHSTT